MEQKRCSVCLATKAVTEFHRKPTGKFGVTAACKACISFKNAENHKANRDANLANMRRYREANTEKIKAEKRAYYLANRELIIGRSAERYLANRPTEAKPRKARQKMSDEERREKRRQSYLAHREQRIADSAAWVAANRERARANQAAWYASLSVEDRKARERAANFTRRSRQRISAVRGSASRTVLLEVIASGPCAYCGAEATEVDHIVPLTLGGTHERSNLTPACRRCNRSKGAKSLNEWLAS